jgi:Prokaryotic glutathione synthetase, N-terminal domain.
LSITRDDIYATCRNIFSIEANHTNEIYEDDLNLVDFKYWFMRKDPPVDENYINALHLLPIGRKYTCSPS